MALERILEPEAMFDPEEAAEYDAMDFSETDQLFAERAATLAAGADWIVDLGSGNAKIPVSLCALIRDRCRVCAVDMSYEMLRLAVKHLNAGAAKLYLLAADSKTLPFQDDAADVVLSNSLIHHIPDPATVFREIARIAGRTGAILIRDLIRPDTEQELAHLLVLHANSCSELQRRLFSDSLRAALTVQEVRRYLDECGLKDVSVAKISDRHWSAERKGTQAISS